MNFEHLFDDKRKKTFCTANQNEHCYWVPTGNIRSMVGDNVNVTLYCKNCSRREDIFLTSEQFKKIQDFFETMPKLQHTVKVTNPKTKVESDVVLEGLAAFFG